MNKPSFIWRPRTTVVLFAGLATLLMYSVGLYIVTNFQPTTEFRVASGVYHLQVADDEAKRLQGLSGVEKLAANGGLLMKFDSDDKWGIWMKDMKMPIDIVWLDRGKRVVYIVKNAQPDLSTNTVFTPKTNARYVVELPMGSVDKAGIKNGHIAEFDETTSGAWW